MTLGTSVSLVLLALAQQPGPKAPPPKVKDSQLPAVLTLPAPSDASVVNAPLTADEAARIALRLQPTVKAAEGALLAAKGRVTQTGSALNPQVGVYAGYDSVNSISGPGNAIPQEPSSGAVFGLPPVFTYSTAVQGRQLIYDFNQTRNLVRQTEALQGVAESTLVQTQKDLVFQVKNAFYAFASATNLVAVNEQNVVNRQRQLDLADARLRHEIGLPSDVVIAETSKSQAILALNVARDQAEQARVALLRLMGVDPFTPIVPNQSAEAPLPGSDPKGLIDVALKMRPEVLEAQQNVSASKYGLSAAKAFGFPSIYAEAAVGAAGYSFPLKDNSSSIGLGLSWNLIDGGARTGAVQTAQGQLNTALANLQGALIAVRNDVTAAYQEVQSSEQRIGIANDEVTNATEGVRIAEGRYSEGLGLFQDILTAEGLLVSAQSDQANAVAALNQARAELRHAIGEVFAGK